MRVEVHGADVQDRDGAKGLLLRSRRLYPFVERVFADGGYAGKLVNWAKDKANLALDRRAHLCLDHEVPEARPGLRATPHRR